MMAKEIEVPGLGVVEFPDHMSDAEITKAIKANSKPASVEAGSFLNQIPRQLGLAARYGLEGAGQAAEIITEPIRQNITDPLARLFYKPDLSTLVTGKKAPQGRPLGQEATLLADRLSLPKPEGANERVVADATRLVAGVASGAGLASGAAKLLPKAGQLVASRDLPKVASGKARQYAEALAANPGQQGVGAAGGGLAMGASREAGGDPTQQFGAGLVGSVVVPLATQGLANGAKWAAFKLKDKFASPALNTQVENQINLTLKGVGIDWNDIDVKTRQAVREEVKKATTTGGQLNPSALKRMIDFKQVGATPTQATVTLDPIQITREKNLAKVGANSMDAGLHSLSRIENANNQAFITTLNDAGAAKAPDAHLAGQKLIDALNAYADGQRAHVGSLYQSARDSAGRSAELDGYAFTQRANQLLQENLAGKLPTQIEDVLNNIASGKVPLTVDHAEQIKTALGRIQRSSSDGNERYAMGLIRQALDDAPLKGAAPVNPGNLPAAPRMVPPSTAGAGQQAIEAFNQARGANRQFIQTVESVPALKAAMDGAQPDNFLRQFVTGTGNKASVNSVSAMTELLRGGKLNAANLPATAEQINKLPAEQGAQALEGVKNAIAHHLKRQALGGAADEVGTFSASAYNRALSEIGDRKLSLFFSPQEIRQLKALGRVSSYSQVQPKGSAVNNSNSGALAVGSAMDMLSRIAPRVPGLHATLNGWVNGYQQGQAANASLGLLTPRVGSRFADQLTPGLLASEISEDAQRSTQGRNQGRGLLDQR